MPTGHYKINRFTKKFDFYETSIDGGFPNLTDSAITFTDGTRTLQIAPTGTQFSFFVNGRKLTKTSAQSVVIPDTEGIHFVYFDNTGTLVSSVSFDVAYITENALVVIIYWDATNNVGIYVADERHGIIMDGATHLHLHEGFGSRYVSGLALSGITADGTGNNDTDAQCAVSDGVIRDEDLRHSIVDDSPQDLDPTAQIPLFYRSGASGDWRKVAATNFPVTTTGTGRAAWNEFTGGAWQLSEVGNANFVLVHLVATNDTLAPVFGFVGQAEYSTVSAARAGAEAEVLTLQLGVLDDVIPEWVVIATLIFQASNGYSNTVKSRIRSTADGGDYIDWRVSVVGGGGSSFIDGDAIHDNVAGEINAIAEKGSPVAADLLLLEDSADSYNKKKVQITNLPAGGAATVTDIRHFFFGIM